jgi:hypothetical protein
MRRIAYLNSLFSSALEGKHAPSSIFNSVCKRFPSKRELVLSADREPPCVAF